MKFRTELKSTRSQLLNVVLRPAGTKIVPVYLTALLVSFFSSPFSIRRADIPIREFALRQGTLEDDR